MESRKVKNPLTGRMISVDGKRYKDLVKNKTKGGKGSTTFSDLNKNVLGEIAAKHPTVAATLKATRSDINKDIANISPKQVIAKVPERLAQYIRSRSESERKEIVKKTYDYIMSHLDNAHDQHIATLTKALIDLYDIQPNADINDDNVMERWAESKLRSILFAVTNPRYKVYDKLPITFATLFKLKPSIKDFIYDDMFTWIKDANLVNAVKPYMPSEDIKDMIRLTVYYPGPNDLYDPSPLVENLIMINDVREDLSNQELSSYIQGIMRYTEVLKALNANNPKIKVHSRVKEAVDGILQNINALQVSLEIRAKLKEFLLYLKGVFK
jgi:hypothetical protein